MNKGAKQRIILIVFTDGRFDCLKQTLDSLHKRGKEAFSPLVELVDAILVDDSGDPAYALRLDNSFANDFRLIIHHGQRLGFCGTIRDTWARLPMGRDYDFVFHLEDDFVFERDIDLGHLVETMALHPEIVQIAFKRQAWNEAERRAGGVVEANPRAFVDKSWDGLEWMEHQAFFTTNPSLYRREIVDIGWPEGEECEGKFGFELWKRGYKVAYWGARSDAPWVTHIGDERKGKGY